MRKAFPIAAIVVVLAWSLTIITIPIFFRGPASANEFGDMFGAINALFSGLALAALVATLWLQQQELAKQSDMQQEQTITLKKTARLHALNALLSSYTQQISLAQGTLSGQEFTRVDTIREELEKLVREAQPGGPADAAQ
jgi:hypothetical protein